MQGKAVGEGAGAQRGCKGLGHQAGISLHGAPSWKGLFWWQLPLEGSLPCWKGSSLCSHLTLHPCTKKYFMRCFAFQSSLYFPQNLQWLGLKTKDAGCKGSVGPHSGVPGVQHTLPIREAMGSRCLPTSCMATSPLCPSTLQKFTASNAALHCM